MLNHKDFTAEQLAVICVGLHLLRELLSQDLLKDKNKHLLIQEATNVMTPIFKSVGQGVDIDHENLTNNFISQLSTLKRKELLRWT